MARYSVKFEIEVLVDEPDITTGEIDEDVYSEKHGIQKITDDEWNQIVEDAVNLMEDAQNCVTYITRLEDEDE